MPVDVVLHVAGTSIPSPHYQGEKDFSDFRLAEIDAAHELLFGEPLWGGELNPVRPAGDTAFFRARFRSREDARRVAVRLVSLVGGLKEVLAEGENHEQVLAALAALDGDPRMAELRSPHLSFNCEVQTFGVRYSHAEKVARRDAALALVRPAGPCRPGGADLELLLLADHENVEPADGSQPRIRRVFFTRMLERGRRHELLASYALTARPYIGPTSTNTELSFYMANQALVAPGRRVYDPFAGSGSLLLAAAVFGGFVTGADIDFRALHGYKKDVRGPDIFDNFRQARLARPELVCADATVSPLRPGLEFDAIVCDPPYGVRAGARRTGRRPAARKAVVPMEADPEQDIGTHVPATRHYEPSDVMDDLFRLAAERLTVRGRLVFLLPVHCLAPPRHDELEAVLPAHPCLRLVRSSVQALRYAFFRLCVTVEKVAPCARLPAELTRTTRFFEAYNNYRDATFQNREEREARLQQAGPGPADPRAAGAAKEPAEDRG